MKENKNNATLIDVIAQVKEKCSKYSNCKGCPYCTIHHINKDLSTYCDCSLAYGTPPLDWNIYTVSNAIDDLEYDLSGMDIKNDKKNCYYQYRYSVIMLGKLYQLIDSGVSNTSPYYLYSGDIEHSSPEEKTK